MKDNLKQIQIMTLQQMERLSDNEYMESKGKEEIARANALSQNATTFIKTINIGLRITEMQEKFNINEIRLKEKLGIYEE